jgi:hypothetical protein
MFDFIGLLAETLKNNPEWEKREPAIEEIRKKLLGINGGKEVSILDILSIICSPYSPRHCPTSSDRYPPGMMEIKCVEEAAALAKLSTNPSDKRNLWDYVWCCDGKEKIIADNIDIQKIFLDNIDLSEINIINVEHLTRAMVLAAEENDSIWKGRAIKKIEEYFDYLFTNNKLPDAAQFLEELDHALRKFKGMIAIFSPQYSKAIELLETREELDFTCAMMLSRILELEKFNYKAQLRYMKAGQNHEFMAEHGANDLTKLLGFEQAELNYNRADCVEDAKRVSQKRLRIGKALKMPTVHIEFPEEITGPIHGFANSVKQSVLEMEYGKAIFHLGNDPFEIRLKETEFTIPEDAPINSPFDFPGIVVSMRTKADGRSNKEPDNVPNKIAREQFAVWKMQTGIKLVYFEDSIHKLLPKDSPEIQDRFKFMVNYLSESTGAQKQSTYKCGRFLNAFCNAQYYEFLCMAIPYLEDALRCIIDRVGINPVQLKNIEGEPTQYKTLDLLYRDEVKKVLPDDVAFSLQMILTYGRFNIGLNLRNDVAHGILHWEEFNSFNASLILVFLFILSGVSIWIKKNQEKKDNGSK